MTKLRSPELTDCIVAVEREIAMRRAVYPRRVEARKMTQQKADWEIACMELTLHNLKDLAQFLPPQDRLDAAREDGPTNRSRAPI